MSNNKVRFDIELKGQRVVKAIMWDKSKGHCWYCGAVLNPFWTFSIDHLIPTFDGGDDDLSNFIPCCRSCNASKHTLTLDEFRARLLKKKLGKNYYTPEQFEYLESEGSDMSKIRNKQSGFKFWFEKEGLAIDYFKPSNYLDTYYECVEEFNAEINKDKQP